MNDRQRAWTGWALLTACLLPVISPATPKATVQVDRESAFLGETILLTLRIRDAETIDTPDLSALTGCTTRVRGSQNINVFRQEFVYGAPPKTLREIGRDYSIEITPQQAGPLRLAPIRVRADNEFLEIAGPTILVRDVEASEWAEIRLHASRDTVLVDEAFEIELTIALRALPAPYDQNHPLDPEQPPRITAAFLEDAAMEGLDGPDMQRVLQSWVRSDPRAPAFLINNHRFQSNPFGSVFGMGSPFEERKARFLPPHEYHTGGAPASPRHIYRMRMTYTGKQEGRYTFGPADLRGAIITQVGVGGRVRTLPVFVRADAITVRVVPPPMEGRPAAFIGVIGSNLTVSATLDTQTCQVGDPLTLSITIGGDINLAQARAPRLTEIADMASRFRLYDDTVRTVTAPDQREFRYTIRPMESGTLEIPPVPIAYYDVRQRAYRTLYTPPLPIRVNDAPLVGGEIIVSASPDRQDQEITFTRADALDIGGITMSPLGALPQPWATFHPHGLLAGVGPAAAGAVLLAKAIYLLGAVLRRRMGPHAWALRRAEFALRSLQHRTGGGAPPQSLRRVWAAYLAARLGVAGSGLGPHDVQRVLEAQPGLDPDLITRITTHYRHGFNAEYSGAFAAPAVTDSQCADARKLLRELDQALRASPSRQPGTRISSS